MIEMRATVRNSQGIHCRPSAEIVRGCAKFQCEMTVTGSSGLANPKSIIGLIALGLAQGDKVVIQADGADEKQACKRLVELFETHFDFPPRAAGKDDSDVLSGTPPA